MTKGKIFIDIYIYLAEYNIFGIERARTGRGKGNVCKTIQEGNKSLKLLDQKREMKLWKELTCDEKR